MESESHEEAGDEEIESGAAGNESDMDLDLLAESDSDSEESQVRHRHIQVVSYWDPLFQPQLVWVDMVDVSQSNTFPNISG